MVMKGKAFWLLAVCALGVLLIPACTDSVSPPAEVTYSAGNYLWGTTPPPIRYYRETGERTEIHILEFENGAVLDTRYDTLGSRLGSTTLHRQHTNGTDILLGCNAYSLPYVPEHLRFQPYLYTVPGPEVAARSWMNMDRDLIFIGGKNGTLYRFRPASDEWEAIEIAWSSPVTALNRDLRASGQLLVATESEGLFRLGIYDSTWTHIATPAGSISDIECDGNGALFVVIDGHLYVRHPERASWDPFPLPSLAENVTHIAIINYDFTHSMLFVGRHDGALAQIHLQSSWPTQLTTSDNPGTESIVQIRASLGSPYSAVAVAMPPVLYVTPENSGFWASVPLPSTIRPTAVCQSDISGDVIVGTEDGVYRFDGSPVRRSGLEGQHVYSLHFGKDNAFYCGTGIGTYRSVDGGINWTRIDATPQIRQQQSGMTLLPASFAVGSSWTAGQVLTGGSVGVELHGRVLEHFDRLLLPGDRGTYNDVIAARYALEDATGSPQPGSYYWTIYFARDRGPVFIEEVIDNNIVARVWQVETLSTIPTATHYPRRTPH
ncbi:hypothetical protein KQI65_03800 [bacterium]|nr:hypothetical protein [bacterium]